MMNIKRSGLYAFATPSSSLLHSHMNGSNSAYSIIAIGCVPCGVWLADTNHIELMGSMLNMDGNPMCRWADMTWCCVLIYEGVCVQFSCYVLVWTVRQGRRIGGMFAPILQGARAREGQSTRRKNCPSSQAIVWKGSSVSIRIVHKDPLEHLNLRIPFTNIHIKHDHTLINTPTPTKPPQ